MRVDILLSDPCKANIKLETVICANCKAHGLDVLPLAERKNDAIITHWGIVIGNAGLCRECFVGLLRHVIGEYLR